MSPRPLHIFQCPALGELTRQLRFNPPERRLAQIERAERLHDEIDPNAEYPLEFIVYRITGYRSEYQQNDLFAGQAIQPDLRLLIDILSRSVGVPVRPDEEVESPTQLARRLRISTKTLSRWRKLGLRWRWVNQTGIRRKRVVYPHRAVVRFLAGHPDLVERAAEFTQIDSTTRARIVMRARRIAQARQVSLNTVAAHLAKRTGRALQTIRLILEKHDAHHPQDRIFLDRTGPLDTRQKHVIARAVRRGIALHKICTHFKRTRSSIYRALHEVRAAEFRKLPITYFPLPTFTREDADAVFLRPLDPALENSGYPPPPAMLHDLSEPMQVLYRGPGLSDELLHTLLVRLNYLKYKAASLRDHLDRYEPRATQLDQIDNCLRQAATLRQQIVRGSLPTVLAVARQHLIGRQDPANHRLLQLLEVGNQVLYDALEHCDIAGSRTFAAYLNWSLMRRFAALVLLTAPPAAPQPSDLRAHRKDEPRRAFSRMIDQAGESGIDLKLEPENTDHPS